MRNYPRRRRRGTLMIGVLACLVVVTSMVGLIVRDALAARRETKIRLQMQQTERLLDAGILRSAIRSEEDRTYTGESWQPKLQLAGQDAQATVTIVVADGRTTVTARIGIAPNITTQSYVYSSSKVQ